MSTASNRTATVSERAVVARINRALDPDQRIRRLRGAELRRAFGELVVWDWSRGYPVEVDVDLEALGRELGVLADHERVEGSS